MTIIAIEGISHKTAPVDIREQFSLTRTKRADLCRRFTRVPGIQEAAILDTCNRFELYLVADNEPAITRASTMAFISRDSTQSPYSTYSRFVYNYRQADAIRHLFEVACSIDSMILGEPQILGQVKDTIQHARECDTAGCILNNLFDRAISFGKRMRTQTQIGTGTVSVPTAAVKLIQDTVGELDQKTIVLIGTGKMNEIAAARLINESGARVVIASRSIERAREFTRAIPSAVPVEFDFALSCIEHADVVLSSSNAPHYLVHREQMEEIMKRRRFKPMLMIDIAVPRDVDPQIAGLDGVSLYNIDFLQNTVDKNLERRQQSIEEIETLSQQETAKFSKWLSIRDIKPVIIGFRQYIQDQCAEEMTKLRNMLGDDLTPEQRDYLDRFSRSIANKIAHQPIVRMKNLLSNGKGVNIAGLLKDLIPISDDEKKDK